MLRRHLTFANVCSALALVVAVGTGGAYAANTVRSGDIVNGQVKRADLRDNAVRSTKIKDGQVARADLAVGSVDSLVLQDGSVASADLATGSVGSAEVAPGAIAGDKVVDGSITAADLAVGSVNTDELQSNAVTGSKVAADSLTSSDVAGGASTGTITISAGAVPNGRCDDLQTSVSGGALAGDAVVLTPQADMQDGVFFYAVRVVDTDTVRVLLCNLSGAAQVAITNLPVRILTYR